MGGMHLGLGAECDGAEDEQQADEDKDTSGSQGDSDHYMEDDPLHSSDREDYGSEDEGGGHPLIPVQQAIDLSGVNVPLCKFFRELHHKHGFTQGVTDDIIRFFQTYDAKQVRAS